MSVTPMNVFLSQDNLNQALQIIDTEVKKQTNGLGIMTTPKYKNSLPKMAQIVLQKCGPSTPSIQELNNKLIQSAVQSYVKNMIKDGLVTSSASKLNSAPQNYVPQPVVMPTANTTRYANPLGSVVRKMPSFDITNEAAATLNQTDVMYNNIQQLQTQDGMDPMSFLNQFQTQREQDIINASPQQTPKDMIFSRNEVSYFNPLNSPIITPTQTSELNQLYETKVGQIEKSIVASNEIPYTSPLLNTMEAKDNQKLQRDTQPGYTEKVHYISVNSGDREWDIGNTLTENRYNYQVKFNQKYDPNNQLPGVQITNIFRNILSVELVMAIMPYETFIEPIDTRLYFNVTKYPYLLLQIEELDRVFNGTNNATEAAFSMLIFDKTYFTETLSSAYASESSTAPGIVNSIPAVSFASEFRRGYIKYQPVYFEKKKFYNNPLASLNRMTIHITDDRGYDFNAQSDVLNISDVQAITLTASNAAVNTEIVPSQGFPTQTPASSNYLKITTVENFSNRLFRIGDRIIIRNFVSNDSTINTYLNDPAGHTIINLQLEQTNGGGTFPTDNKTFINTIYIAQPGEMNANNNGLVDFYTPGALTVTNGGKLINRDLQSTLMFRIVTRDGDILPDLKPINA